MDVGDGSFFGTFHKTYNRESYDNKEHYSTVLHSWL